MRKPTPPDVALAWWRDALAGRAAIHEGDPHPGFYEMKMKAGRLPVEIAWDAELDEFGDLAEPEKLVAFVRGRPADPARIWTRLRAISLEEFEALTDRPQLLREVQTLSTAPAIRPPRRDA